MVSLPQIYRQALVRTCNLRVGQLCPPSNREWQKTGRRRCTLSLVQGWTQPVRTNLSSTTARLLSSTYSCYHSISLCIPNEQKETVSTPSSIRCCCVMSVSNHANLHHMFRACAIKLLPSTYVFCTANAHIHYNTTRDVPFAKR